MKGHCGAGRVGKGSEGALSGMSDLYAGMLKGQTYILNTKDRVQGKGYLTRSFKAECVSL